MKLLTALSPTVSQFLKQFSLFSVTPSYFQSKENEILAQERRKNINTKMDIQPKTREKGLRGVKTKTYQRTGCTQRQKFKNTLQQWLIKPSKKTNTGEMSDTSEDPKTANACGFQGTSDQSMDYQKSALSDSEEETQPLTPQDLDKCSLVKCSKEQQEVEANPRRSGASAIQNAKVTDFFSGSTSGKLPVKQSRQNKDADMETNQDIDKTNVKWLGTPISELRRLPECSGPLPPLKDVPDTHTVMIRV